MPQIKHLFFSLFLLLAASAALAQTPVQTLRGKITDADNARPMAGATIILTETLGTTSGENGAFSIPNVPVGRYRMQVSFVGYETLTVAEVLVESGKETVQEVALREQGQALQEVTVKAAGSGSAALHPLSVHTLTVEEQFRFPATFNDPARLAMSFPGVAGADDQGNSISVRGNSPASVKWRLEGVEIVNPNHTSNAGTFSDRPTQAGGGVNILSAQLLGNSNFLTGAYPAEYGNALGGILDMRLRKGNEQRHEFTAQAGFIGLEAAAEGPISKKSGASYLVNYRYSFTGLLTAMGVDFGDEEIRFEDLGIHLSFPKKKAGNFTAFLVAGQSKNLFRSPGDTALIEEEKQLYDIDFESRMGATGVTHVVPIGKKSVLRTVGVYSYLYHERRQLKEGELVVFDDFDLGKLACSTVLSTKITSTHRLKTGIFLNLEDVWAGYYSQGKGWLVQPFIEWSAQLFPKTTMTAGLHVTWFTFNKTGSLEPRLAFTYAPDARRRFSLSGGLHSQLQPWDVYLSEDFSGEQNKNIGLTKAAHFVAGYRQTLDKSLIFNAEVYFQHLFNVPISPLPGGTFSTLNLMEMSPQNERFPADYLANNGTGKNYGLDLSLQKFILERTYFLLSGSLYRSLYTAGDGKERPTRWDGKRLLSLSAGREFSRTKKEKTVMKGVNARLAWLGGFRTMPIDEYRSTLKGTTVFKQSEGYAHQLPDYLRLDLRFYLKWNKTGRNSLLSLDIQNATNRKNVAYEYYDSLQQRFLRKRQLGLIPVLSYRIEF